MPEYTFDQSTKELAQEVVNQLVKIDADEHSYVAYYLKDERGVNNLAQVFADLNLSQVSVDNQTTVKSRKYGNVG